MGFPFEIFRPLQKQGWRKHFKSSGCANSKYKTECATAYPVQSQPLPPPLKRNTYLIASKLKDTLCMYCSQEIFQGPTALYYCESFINLMMLILIVSISRFDRQKLMKDQQLPWFGSNALRSSCLLWLTSSHFSSF